MENPDFLSTISVFMTLGFLHHVEKAVSPLNLQMLEKNHDIC